MKTLKKFLVLVAAFVAVIGFMPAMQTVMGSAALVVPDDYEYEDEWDDSYLLGNLDGEQIIDAEGTPPAMQGETGKTNFGCGASISIGGVSVVLMPALAALLLKKKHD